MAANFIVQSDDGDVVNANAYIDTDFLIQYCEDNGIELDGEAEGYQTDIVVGTRYIDTYYKYASRIYVTEQTTQFPRVKWVGVPVAIKQATAELALRQHKLRDSEKSLFDDPVYEAGGMRVKGFTKKVGPIEKTVSYDESSYSAVRKYPVVEALLSEFLLNGGSMNFSVGRG